MLLLSLILLSLSLIWLPSQNSTINYWIIAFTVTTIMLISAIIILRKVNWEEIIMSMSILNKTLRIKLFRIIKKIFEGLDAIKKTNYMKGILLSTVFIWVCYYFMTVLLLESCQIYLMPSGSFIILVMGAVIIAVPALPGGIGTYEAGITYILMLLYFLNKDIALTYALVSHASNYIPFLGLGSIYFIISGLRISDIKNMPS